MRLFFQDKEDVLYQTDDCGVIPNVGESVRIGSDWYEVVERTFYYGNPDRIRQDSVTCRVKPSKIEGGSSLWHDGSEKPQTGRILFESTAGGFSFADYDLKRNRFDSDDECYYSGMWERCHIKRWMYEQDIFNL